MRNFDRQIESWYLFDCSFLKIDVYIMTLSSVTIICIVMVVSAILIAIFRKSTENELHQSFVSNMNLSSCAMCIRNDSPCYTFDFQLDYKRHTDHDRYLNYLSLFILTMMRLFNTRTNRKIFFGTLKYNNGIAVRTVAKVAGHYDSSKLMQMVYDPTTTNIDSKVLESELNVLTSIADNHSLFICSKHDTNSFTLKYNVLNSVFSYKSSNSSQLWLETWVAAHLNAEPIILRALNGYRYAPKLYGTCGQVNFVEDCGYTLQYHYHKLNLSNRLLVAKELLKLALELTDGTSHPNYSFYLTDLTADNVAIQLDEISGSFQSLKVIDWSDVIIVFHNISWPREDDLIIHVSEHIDCGMGCLTYSKNDICSASISDHNVYAVCKEFLSTNGRLLYEITDLDNSKNILDKEVEELRLLMKHCLLHSDVKWNLKKNRLDIAKSIIKVIEQIYDHGLYYDYTNDYI